MQLSPRYQFLSFDSFLYLHCDSQIMFCENGIKSAVQLSAIQGTGERCQNTQQGFLVNEA